MSKMKPNAHNSAVVNIFPPAKGSIMSPSLTPEVIQLRRSVREAHHRIKNHLQALAALVDIQLLDGQEMIPAEELRRIGIHIRTLATIHDLLTNPPQSHEEADHNHISAADLLGKVLEMLRQTEGHHQIQTTIEDIQIPVGIGTALALIVNELVSNACKHGDGEVEIKFHVVKREGMLIVQDGGPGFTKEFDPITVANTGLELIESLVSIDLNGQVIYRNGENGGACVTVLFPFPP